MKPEPHTVDMGRFQDDPLIDTDTAVAIHLEELRANGREDLFTVLALMWQRDKTARTKTI